MASEVGAKSSGTGCWDCYKPKRTNKDKTSEIAKSTSMAPSRRGYTPKEIQDFSHLVKADDIHSSEERASEEKTQKVFNKTKK